MTEFNGDKFLRRISFAELADLEKMEISSFRTVRSLQGAANEIFIGILMAGKSLEHLGIFHGDILITKMTKRFDERNLYVWNTPNGKTAKYAEMSCAEITLHDGDGWRETFSRSLVEMVGVVVRVERDLKVKR